MSEHGMQLAKAHHHRSSSHLEEMNMNESQLQLDPPIHELVLSYALDQSFGSDKANTAKSGIGEVVRHPLAGIVKEAIQHELKKLQIAKAVEQVSHGASELRINCYHQLMGYHV
jgi:hypothetical protein